jgi:enoyl-CoA hydratase
MRYMLTGEHWGAEEAFRMRAVQEIAPAREKALEAGIAIATKIAACGPLGSRQRSPRRIWQSTPRRRRPCQNSMRNMGRSTEPKTSGKAAQRRQRPPTDLAGQVIALLTSAVQRGA